MTEKYMMVNLDDKRSQKLGEAISNPTCKKIINLLAEKELSATEISRALKVPMNTLDYNLKKLVESGIIEKSKHFWSVKGKKIPTYKVVNKVIVIQPKKTSSSNTYSKLKNISLMVGISAILTGLIAWLTKSSSPVAEESLKAASYSQDALCIGGPTEATCASGGLSQIPAWSWFGIGALIVIILILIINWKKL